MKILFLDDDQERHEKAINNAFPSDFWSHVFCADSCIKELQNKKWDLVSLDHDLNGKPFDSPGNKNSGSEVVRWIIENKPDVESFIVHSYNHIEAPKMVSQLRKAGYVANYEPFNY